MIQDDSNGFKTVLVADLIGQVGASPDSIRSAFGSTLAEVRLEWVLKWLEPRVEPFGNWSAEKASRAKRFRDALHAELKRIESAETVSETPKPGLESAEPGLVPEPTPNFDFRVFSARAGLWLITFAQIALVLYGCHARFGMVGLAVAAMPCVFLVVVNITATDDRFWGTTDTGFWVAVLLAAVFGALHFFTLRDLLVLSLSESAKGWFCGVSAFIIEAVALAALSLQSKISNEQ